MRRAPPGRGSPRATAVRALCTGLAGAALVLGRTSAALALDAEDASAEAAREIQAVRSELSRLAPGQVAQRRGIRSTEKMIASGELALRAKDYARAIDIFNQVVELYRQGKASSNAHADGSFLLAQAYFESGQLLSARRQYGDLLALAKRSPYDSYAGRSLARLVDVAVQTGQLGSLEAIAARVEALPRSEPSGSLDYARGKLNLARGRFDEALAFLGAVPEASRWHHQARYVMGVVLAKRALSGAGFGPSVEAQVRLVVPDAGRRLAPALAQFHEVTGLPRDTPEHAQVIDLAWLAIGRLSYESENYVDAAQAYIQVGRESPVYYEMLYELAWVYVRVGDYTRAERALELLSVAAPDTLDIADGALLRADLMLRSGRFESALASYEDVRSRFEPARARVDRFLAAKNTAGAYYDRLVDDGLPFGGPASLPDVVIDWARDEARGDRVLSLVDDVTHARELQRRSRRLSSKLNAILATASRARAFPAIETALEGALGLVNRLSRARRSIALGLDDASDAGASRWLADARRRRRALMGRVAAMPITPADFLRREERGERRWKRVSQALQRTTLETDKLQAVINGLRQLLDQADEHGVTRNAASRARFADELEANERELRRYRRRIDEYREQVENGRMQLGLGDRRFAEDEQARRGFRQALNVEVELLSAGHGDDEALDYARSVAPMLAEIGALERRAEGVIAALEAEVSLGVGELSRQVADETEQLERYARELEALDDEARVVVGEVAKDNFASVRQRLKSIVLRADVGIVQHAWELREEQQVRLRGLQRQRALEEQKLEDELREVADDAGEGL